MSDPAFPRPAVLDGGQFVDKGAEGMTLRDWFAGIAMQAFISNQQTSRGWYRINGEELEKAMLQTANAAWEMADAMLRERYKNNDE